MMHIQVHVQLLQILNQKLKIHPLIIKKKKNLTQQKQNKIQLSTENTEFTAQHQRDIAFMRPILQKAPPSDNITEALKYMKIFENHQFVTEYKWNFVETTYNDALSVLSYNKKEKSSPPPYYKSCIRSNNKSISPEATISHKHKPNLNDQSDSKSYDKSKSKNNIPDGFYTKNYCVYCDTTVPDALKHMEYAKDTMHREGDVYVCRFPIAKGSNVMCGKRFCNGYRLFRHHHTQHAHFFHRNDYLPDSVNCDTGCDETARQKASHDGGTNKWRYKWCSVCKRRSLAKTDDDVAAINANIIPNKELDELYPVNWHNKNKTNTNNTIVDNDNTNTNTENTNTNTENDEEYTSSQLNANKKYIECGFCKGFFPKDVLMQHMKDIHY
eukprot:444493_1